MTTACTLFVNNKYQKLRESMSKELDELVSDITEIRGQHATPEGFKKKVAQYLKQTSESKLINEREQLKQIAKRELNLKLMMDPGFKGDHAEGLASLLRTTNYNAKDGGLSIEAVMGSHQKKYNTFLEQSLTEGEMKVLATRSLDSDIIMYLSSGGKGEVSDQVKKFGDLFRKFQDKLHADKTSSGIDLNYRENYAVNQRDIYNFDKMRNDYTKESWAEMAHSRLDLDKTFPLMTNRDDQIKYLQDVYDGFIQRGLDKEAVDFNNIDPSLIRSSIQRKNLQPRVMQFSPEGLSQMWAEFADKSVLDSMVADGARASRDIGVYEVLGPNGQNEFNTLKQKTIRNLQKEIAGAADEKAKVKLQKQIDKIEGKSKGSIMNFSGDYDSLWANINGKVDQVGSKALAQAGDNIRSLVSMQVLGGSMFTALTDVFNGVTALNMATGQGYFKSMADVGMGLLSSFKPSEQRRIAGMTNIALETAIGSILKGANAENSLSKGINKLNYFYSKVNPIAAQGRFHRVAATMMFGMRMADQIGKNAWDQIDLSVRGTLEKAGLKDIDLDSIKMLTSEVKDGHNIITNTAINNITDAQAMDAIAKHRVADKAFWPSKPAEYRSYLSKRVDVLYDEFANFAAPNPGLRERAFLHGSSQKGTYGGEMIRMVSMLKSFTVKQASIMQKIYLNSPTKAGKLQHLSAQTIGLMGMGYVALSLRAIANNESPPDPSSPATLKRAFLASGAAGLMGDMLLSEAERGAGPLTSFAAGPVLSKTDDLIKFGKKLVTGEGSLKSFGQLSDFVPGGNLHVLKAAAAYTFLDDFKEAASEGHRERMQQRRREASGSLWAPHKIIDN
jgi:hypothetical protein